MAALAVDTMPSVTISMLGHGFKEERPSEAAPAPSCRADDRSVWGTRSWHRAWQTIPALRLPGPRLGIGSDAKTSS